MIAWAAALLGPALAPAYLLGTAWGWWDGDDDDDSRGWGWGLVITIIAVVAVLAWMVVQIANSDAVKGKGFLVEWQKSIKAVAVAMIEFMRSVVDAVLGPLLGLVGIVL